MEGRVVANYQPIFETTYQYWLSPAIYIVTKLKIAEFLKDSKKNIDEIFGELKDQFPNLNKDNLYRLMRNISAVGLFQEDGSRNFTLGSLGQELLDDKIQAFILDNIGKASWDKIVNVGEQENFEHFDYVFLQDTPEMSEALSNIILAYRYSKALYLFVKLGLADVMSNASYLISDIARKTNIEPNVIENIFTLLCDKGIIIKNVSEKYSLTDTGKLLVTDNPWSLKNVALHENIPKWQAAANLIVAITKSKEPFEFTHGEGLFDYLKKLEDKDKQEFDIFNKAMAEISKIEIMAIAQNLIIPKDTKTIMDVGGGTGALISALLEQHDKLQGIVFDLPETVAQIKNPGERCQSKGGSFFEKETIPPADLILLKRALHDWSNDKAIEILKNCAEKCKELRVIEWLWKDNAFVASLDLFLMSIGGKIRSEQDFRFLFESAGISCPDFKELTAGVFAVHGVPSKEHVERHQVEMPRQSVSAMINLGSVYASPTPVTPLQSIEPSPTIILGKKGK